MEPVSERYIAQVKNVEYQSRTVQLQDDMAHVMRGGWAGRVEVIIDKRTQISLPLLREHLNPASPLKVRVEDLNPAGVDR